MNRFLVWSVFFILALLVLLARHIEPQPEATMRAGFDIFLQPDVSTTGPLVVTYAGTPGTAAAVPITQVIQGIPSQDSQTQDSILTDSITMDDATAGGHLYVLCGYKGADGLIYPLTPADLVAK